MILTLCVVKVNFQFRKFILYVVKYFSCHQCNIYKYYYLFIGTSPSNDCIVPGNSVVTTELPKSGEVKSVLIREVP